MKEDRFYSGSKFNLTKDDKIVKGVGIRSSEEGVEHKSIVRNVSYSDESVIVSTAKESRIEGSLMVRLVVHHHDKVIIDTVLDEDVINLIGSHLHHFDYRVKENG